MAATREQAARQVAIDTFKNSISTALGLWADHENLREQFIANIPFQDNAVGGWQANRGIVVSDAYRRMFNEFVLIGFDPLDELTNYEAAAAAAATMTPQDQTSIQTFVTSLDAAARQLGAASPTTPRADFIEGVVANINPDQRLHLREIIYKTASMFHSWQMGVGGDSDDEEEEEEVLAPQQVAYQPGPNVGAFFAFTAAVQSAGNLHGAEAALNNPNNPNPPPQQPRPPTPGI